MWQILRESLSSWFAWQGSRTSRQFRSPASADGHQGRSAVERVGRWLVPVVFITHGHRHPHRVRRHRPTLVAEDSYVVPGDSFLTDTPIAKTRVSGDARSAQSLCCLLYT